MHTDLLYKPKEEISTILHSLTALKPISLKEMEDVALLKRNDTKFVIHIRDLNQVLKGLKGHYRVLEIAQCRLMTYESLYFDTRNYRFFADHHNGKANKTAGYSPFQCEQILPGHAELIPTSETKPVQASHFNVKQNRSMTHGIFRNPFN